MFIRTDEVIIWMAHHMNKEYEYEEIWSISIKNMKNYFFQSRNSS